MQDQLKNVTHPLTNASKRQQSCWQKCPHSDKWVSKKVTDTHISPFHSLTHNIDLNPTDHPSQTWAPPSPYFSGWRGHRLGVRAFSHQPVPCSCVPTGASQTRGRIKDCHRTPSVEHWCDEIALEWHCPRESSPRDGNRQSRGGDSSKKQDEGPHRHFHWVLSTEEAEQIASSVACVLMEEDFTSKEALAALDASCLRAMLPVLKFGMCQLIVRALKETE